MTSLMFKVPETVSNEIDVIRETEGLGNRTAAFTFLIKYYFLTKQQSLDQSIMRLENALKRVDFDKIPSPEEQLKDIK